MGEGFIGEIGKERLIVLAFFVSGVLAIIIPPMIQQTSGWPILFGWLMIIGALLIIYLSVLRTTGRNGEWLWFAFSLTSGVAPIYYILDWFNFGLVEGA